MRSIIYSIVISALLFTSCATVEVKSDYDTKAVFSEYKSFGFYKNSIDKVEISDLDKKRILRAIDKNLSEKGFSKSTTPDLLVSFSTKAEKSVQVSPNYGYGFGWGWYNPFWFGNSFGNTTYETIHGILIIDLIDAKKNELVWQGVGKAPLVDGPEAKTERVNEIVTAIFAKYPPEVAK